jgi:hypothetical protein
MSFTQSIKYERIHMKSINGKLTISGASWELRAKLSDETKDLYARLKKHYELQAGRALSEGVFLSQLLPDCFNNILGATKDDQR